MTEAEYFRKWMNIYEWRYNKLLIMTFWEKLLFTFLGKLPNRIQKYRG